MSKFIDKNAEILVIGHTNPDTDTICSALAYSFLKNKLGYNTKPVRAGKLNPETEFVLDRFGVNIPELVEDVSGKNVIMLDHTDYAQSVKGMKEANIVEIVDHHKLGDVKSTDQIYVRMEPIGSTATIIAKIFKENNVEFDEKSAGMILSAILSDTVVFKSVTTTDEDVKIAEELAIILDLDPVQFGIEVKKAKSDISNKSDRELIDADLKVFSNLKTFVGQIELVEDINKLRKQSLLQEMKKVMEQKKCETGLMMVTNIMKEDTDLLIVGKKDYVEDAFNLKVENDSIYLKGVMSRKKQIIPSLEKSY